jgi:hypothetical protein
MSRNDEDRILHGLHYYRERIDDEFTVTGEQILWLAAHSFKDGGNWCKNGELQSLDVSVVPGELRTKLLLTKFEVPMRYLNYRRLIKFIPRGRDIAVVAVTFAGADRAMRLHTRTGRMEIWYQEHKDGFLGMVTTIAVAFATALAAVAVADHLHRSAEPSKIIYEVDPKLSP